MTSHDVVATIRRKFATRAVGHTGTLDPFATGLLVVLLGGATRLARFVEAGIKTYRAEARLGFATTTDDLTGEPLGVPSHDWPAETAVGAALGEQVGRRLQRPPAYSAKHVAGQRGYALARRGRPVELEPVEVLIGRVELLEYRPPIVVWRAEVGPGTYLRAMARDLGERLGVGGHLVALRRERVGRFSVEQATPLADLTGAEPLIEPAELVGDLPRVEIGEELLAPLRLGRAVGAAGDERGEHAVVALGRLVAIAEPREGRWQPVLVVTDR